MWRLKVTIKDSGKSRLPLIEPLTITLNAGNLNVAFEDNGLIHLVSASGDLYSYDIERRKNNYIHNIAHLTQRYGGISSIVSFHDDLWISFKGSGILKLVTAHKYRVDLPAPFIPNKPIRLVGVICKLTLVTISLSP